MNPRPQILRLRLYMLIRLFGFSQPPPERQGRQLAIPVLFSASAPEELQRELIIELPPVSAAYKQAADRRLADLSS